MIWPGIELKKKNKLQVYEHDCYAKFSAEQCIQKFITIESFLTFDLFISWSLGGFVSGWKEQTKENAEKPTIA